jgi:CRISPR/Cas system-associated protein Csx1
MVDTTLIDEIKSSLKAQQLRNAAKKCYSKKIKINPEFYEAEKERIKIYKRERYNSDPVFAEKMRQKSREDYYKRKAKLAQLAQ